ncbi:glycosyltransferase family 4 protein [Mucilaginibacter jinjuensis]|uniref:Glycosyltransferase family 1 protein n=1 Tax=Mucilaginibacter jinjuensis TaxID=1176721 RepID=A0ABY7T6L5_9SPHI|nr:glycosyltransferase family 1 protein [Mucilaginibacter jinjuensis]WCT11904.1 glycosyltransferase family 1 protein [Mucilaginibacter jinjuensis]
MLKVLFDYQHFTEQQHGGITRYFANLINDIENRADVDYQVAALYTRNYYLNHLKFPLNNPAGDFLFERKLKRRIKWNRRYSQYLLQAGHYDVFHPTYYHPYFLKYNKKPFVITVHDMIHEKFAADFNTRHDAPIAAYKREVVAKADKIIAISHSTKRDLIELLNVPEEKIELIYHGIAPANSSINIPQQLSLPEEFILYVGNRNSYKNFDRFARAMVSVMQQHKNLFLICAGGSRFNDNELKYLTELNIIQRCIRLDVNDDELAELYQRARAFIYPSLYEGFGLPILEAFQNGCPVVCSNTSSFPEVGGDAALYFDPTHTNEMSKAILQILADDSLRTRLIEAGKKRVLQFSLQDSMDQTVNLYKALA